MIEGNIISKIASGDLSDPRARIVNAAIEEFALRSLDGARTRAIASKSGANSASISYYFGGKRGLYETVIKQLSEFFDGYVAPYYAEGVRLVKSRDAKGAKDLARKFLMDCIRNFSEVKIVPLACLILMREDASPSEYFKCAYESLYERPVAFIARLLSTASGGRLAPDMGIVFAHALWADVRGYSSKSGSVMKLHSWRSLGERELAVIENSLKKVLEKTLK